jgi:hypothetical protein
VHSTPPPFASMGETTGSAPELSPLRPHTPPVVVVKRSVLWPLLAVAGVAVAAAALVLVWHQMQQQVPQQPAVINVTQTPNVATTNPPMPNPPPTNPSTPTTPNDTQHPRVKPHYATYDQALASQQDTLSQCLRDHPASSPTEAIVATITVAASGRGQNVQLKPDALTTTPLGGCLHNVLMATPFPASAKGNTFTVQLKAKS